MRKALLLIWVLGGAGLLAWHLGHGRAGLLGDQAARHQAEAERAAADGDWATAAANYGRARDALASRHVAAPGAHAVIRPSRDEALLSLAQAQARARAGELLESTAQLEALVEQLGERPDPILAEAIRHERAANAYHTAWLMRLEGATPDEWLPESESARQLFRASAESGSAAAVADLEASIRLQRMDLTELQGLALPKKCSNQCKNLSQRKRKQRESRNDDPGKTEQKKPEEDARKKVREESTGADVRQRPDGGS